VVIRPLLLQALRATFQEFGAVVTVVLRAPMLPARAAEPMDQAVKKLEEGHGLPYIK
jgi:hypothetical protein